jgi:hypothetical protein
MGLSFCLMTLSKSEREKNNELALKLMFEDLGDDPVTGPSQESSIGPAMLSPRASLQKIPQS